MTEPGSGVSIRRARTRDFLEIAALDREAWRDYDSGEFIPDGEHVWRHWVDDALVFVGLDVSRIMGAAVALPGLSGDVFLHKIFIAREARGEGLGTELLRAMTEKFDELGVAATLTVQPGNSRARALYERVEFREYEFVKGYYRAHEDRLVMRREPEKFRNV